MPENPATPGRAESTFPHPDSAVPCRIRLRIDRVPQRGVIEPPRPEDIDWCLGLMASPAVLWRAMANPMTQASEWYRKHKKDDPAAILRVVRAAPCRCARGIEIIAHSVSPADGRRLARGMAEALVEYAMEWQLNGAPVSFAVGTAHGGPGPLRPVNKPPGCHLRVMIQNHADAAPER